MNGNFNNETPEATTSKVPEKSEIQKAVEAENKRIYEETLNPSEEDIKQIMTIKKQFESSEKFKQGDIKKLLEIIKANTSSFPDYERFTNNIEVSDNTVKLELIDGENEKFHVVMALDSAENGELTVKTEEPIKARDTKEDIETPLAEEEKTEKNDDESAEKESSESGQDFYGISREEIAKEFLSRLREAEIIDKEGNKKNGVEILKRNFEKKGLQGVTADYLGTSGKKEFCNNIVAKLELSEEERKKKLKEIKNFSLHESDFDSDENFKNIVLEEEKPEGTAESSTTKPEDKTPEKASEEPLSEDEKRKSEEMTGWQKMRRNLSKETITSDNHSLKATRNNVIEKLKSKRQELKDFLESEESNDLEKLTEKVKDTEKFLADREAGIKDTSIEDEWNDYKEKKELDNTIERLKTKEDLKKVEKLREEIDPEKPKTVRGAVKKLRELREIAADEAAAEGKKLEILIKAEKKQELSEEEQKIYKEITDNKETSESITRKRDEALKKFSFNAGLGSAAGISREIDAIMEHKEGRAMNSKESESLLKAVLAMGAAIDIAFKSVESDKKEGMSESKARAVDRLNAGIAGQIENDPPEGAGDPIIDESQKRMEKKTKSTSEENPFSVFNTRTIVREDSETQGELRNETGWGKGMVGKYDNISLYDLHNDDLVRFFSEDSVMGEDKEEANKKHRLEEILNFPEIKERHLYEEITKAKDAYVVEKSFKSNSEGGQGVLEARWKDPETGKNKKLEVIIDFHDKKDQGAWKPITMALSGLIPFKKDKKKNIDITLIEQVVGEDLDDLNDDSVQSSPERPKDPEDVFEAEQNPSEEGGNPENWDVMHFGGPSAGAERLKNEEIIWEGQETRDRKIDNVNQENLKNLFVTDQKEESIREQLGEFLINNGKEEAVGQEIKNAKNCKMTKDWEGNSWGGKKGKIKIKWIDADNRAKLVELSITFPNEDENSVYLSTCEKTEAKKKTEEPKEDTRDWISVEDYVNRQKGITSPSKDKGTPEATKEKVIEEATEDEESEPTIEEKYPDLKETLQNREKLVKIYLSCLTDDQLSDVKKYFKEKKVSQTSARYEDLSKEQQKWFIEKIATGKISLAAAEGRGKNLFTLYKKIRGEKIKTVENTDFEKIEEIALSHLENSPLTVSKEQLKKWIREYKYMATPGVMILKYPN